MKKILSLATSVVTIAVGSITLANGNEEKIVVTNVPSIRSIEGMTVNKIEVANNGFIWGFTEGISNDPSEGGHCDGWSLLALSIGWPADELSKLSSIVHRESRCNTLAFNETDPNGGSRGLMQINGFWCRPWKYSELGFLQERGILNSCDDLYDPQVNLRAGLAIFMYGEDKYGCGWKNAWATRCSK